MKPKADAEPPVVRGSQPAPDDFAPVSLRRLAHDLRGPLSPLQTAAYLLRRDDLGAQRKNELLDIIDRQASRLGSMLQEISDWMRARHGSLVDRREPLNVAMLVELACAQLAATGGRIEIQEALDEVEVMADTGHLVQMLGTLLDYMQTRAGEAGVGVIAALVDRRLRIVIERADAAPVPSPERPEQSPATLFAATEVAPFDGGLGLRLLIARAIAEAHGGSLSAQPSGSGGERLWIDLPVI